MAKIYPIYSKWRREPSALVRYVNWLLGRPNWHGEPRFDLAVMRHRLRSMDGDIPRMPHQQQQQQGFHHQNNNRSPTANRVHKGIAMRNGSPRGGNRDQKSARPTRRTRLTIHSEGTQTEPQFSDRLMRAIAIGADNIPRYLARSVESRNLIDAQHDASDRMENYYEAFVRQVSLLDAAVEEERRSGKAAELTSALDRRNAKVQEANEFFARWQALEDGIKLGQSRLRYFDSRAMRILSSVTKGDILEGLVDRDILQRQLLDRDTQIPSAQNSDAPYLTDPPAPAPAPAPTVTPIAEVGAEPQATTAQQLQNTRDIIRHERAEALQALIAQQQAHEAHFNGNSAAWDLHQNGKDPGLPGWDASWSQETFDLRRLQHGTALTMQLKEAEKRLMKAYKWARDARVPPLDDQMLIFADRTDDGKGSAVVDGPRRVRKEVIGTWLNNMPKTPLQDAHAVFPPSSIPVLKTSRAWDSYSTTALPLQRKYIQKAGKRGPRGRTELSSSSSSSSSPPPPAPQLKGYH